MAFRVGQKVARFSGISRFTSNPPLQVPCTISNIYAARDGEEMIELVEYPEPATEQTEAGFRSKFFRPVVSTKTGMAILEQIRRDVTNKELRPICHDEQV